MAVFVTRLESKWQFGFTIVELLISYLIYTISAAMSIQGGCLGGEIGGQSVATNLASDSEATTSVERYF